MKKNLLKSLVAIAVISISFTACKKDSDTANPSLKVNSAKAVAPGVITPATFTSIWGNPYNPASYTAVYFDFVNTAVSTIGSSQGQFTGQVNSTISAAAGSGFTLHYLYNTSLTLASITLADLAPGTGNNYTTATSIGENTSTGSVPNGWFNYVTSSPSPISGFFAVLEDGTDFYVIQLTGFPNAASRPASTDQNGDGVINGRDIEVRSDVTFSYKLL
jgi:hypothetical protein